MQTAVTYRHRSGIAPTGTAVRTGKVEARHNVALAQFGDDVGQHDKAEIDKVDDADSQRGDI